MMLFPPGIKNCGNLCFANSILQCLLSQRIFKKAFTEFAEHHTNHCADCMPGKGSIAMILILLILFILYISLQMQQYVLLIQYANQLRVMNIALKGKSWKAIVCSHHFHVFFNELLSSDIIVLHVFLSCSNSSITHFWRAV